ncbi:MULTISPECIES: BMP family ABC transporter substrate-binding protein [unclassified Uliginosibacterium]|uniref:BMP family ABC transporter substrate-binding protein n=1 Tax=unclassified Uliginosibacterium TaxID=2621521 RepID=UPI000C7DF364|nr:MULTISPECIES: BMP family ABC transporter substrate-binding protein [unclassified Uliginosibacterium]MDO6385972.1 BMP family ABC transporter substrate-binding protein [Uliginosibacterium sp. 31-12]PLK49982.1 BMP family ABC transporter substrate-binding protein [Uliginosibacterium sp. TH139]
MRFLPLLGRLAALALTACTLAGAAHAEEPLKAGFIYIGPTGDHGWTYAHDEGRKAMEAKFAGKVKTTFVENVPETADAERVIRDLASKGHKVIFATSFGYMNAMDKVARQFPKTVFMHATGYKSGKNLGIYDVRTYEGAYMLGVVAGKMSKSGKLGVVGSIAIPEVVRNINAFTLGARSVNPKATTRVIWVNSWFDPGKEREAALALISQGADVLMQNTDSPAVVQTAQEKGVFAFGWDSDMSKFGGKAQLAASVLNWEVIYSQEVDKVLKGTWKTTDLWYGVKEGAVTIDNFGPAVPADVKKLAEERRDALKAGKLHPFTGPLKDNAGKEMVAAGQTMADADLRKMNAYVEGVEGSIPK